MWYKGQVISGKQIGRKIGFPTINIRDHSIFSTRKKGVYLVEVLLSKLHKVNGLLYFGPRHVVNEKDIVLEIYLLDKIESLNTVHISFRVISFIRPVIRFATLEEAKKRQNEDLEVARRLIQKNKAT